MVATKTRSRRPTPFDDIDRTQARILDSIGRDLHFLSPTGREAYARRLLDKLAYVFTGADLDSEALHVHPDPTLFEDTDANGPH